MSATQQQPVRHITPPPELQPRKSPTQPLDKHKSIDLISYPNDRKGSTEIAGKAERVSEYSISYIDIHPADTLFPARVSVWAADYTVMARQIEFLCLHG